ncbi:unnamed protein product [Rotaria magnacalcarata]|uniref:Homeobox protein cut-like n=2 Tax=Rotaria magnacalcarata TaxID=392030 RepID=A0A816V7G7_9BILA|nr:unnamed protein product [Rotaria magnacalcarata]
MFINHDLDVTTTEIVSCADESDQSRRKLVELTRDFKKNTNEDVRKPITPILKSFQIEIDTLSKQSKLTEETLLKIYQHLSELPVKDPVPILEYTQTLQTGLEKVSDLAAQNQNLKEILDELAHVKSQELTVKQLRDKIKDLEKKTEVIIQQHIKDKEDFQHIFADKDHQFDLIKKYAHMEMHQSVLDHPIHQDIFEYKLKQDDTTNLFSSNNQEQMNKQTSNAERYLCEDFEKNRVTNNKSDELMISQEEAERKLREKLELELAAKERKIVTLVDETQKLQSTLIKIKENSFTQISDLENVLSEKEKLIAQLENKLQTQADYDEIKQELTLLKSIEFPRTTRSNDDQTENLSKKSFETLLLEKDRSLQDEQTQIKMSQIDSESNTNHHQLQHSCRHCTSPCLHRTINAPYIPVPSYLSSSASSSSNSSSSPSSPSQLYFKPPQQSTLNCNGIDEPSKKIIPCMPTSLSLMATTTTTTTTTATKENLQSCNSFTNSKYPSLTTSCSTMVTPTASLLSSVTTTTLTPSNLFPGHQLSSVQCTKLHCPPTSSWSPPLSSSSGVSSIATTSTDNRTVMKSSKQTSPKPSPSPTVLVPSTCSIAVTSNNASLLEPLDTTYVANVVRKLLAQHNIGQRIFARYILSLSQGTVSELLSKPKCWSKLTEKGKESYRKMWCWANSEESILTLKSISPRKGMNNRSKDNPYPAMSTKHTDPATHQKIVQILADAQKQQIAAAVAAAAAAAGQKHLLSPCSSFPNDVSNVNHSTDQFESKSSSSSSNSSSANSSPMNSPSHEPAASDQQTFLLPVPPPQPPPPPPPPSSSTTTPSSLSMLSAFVPSLLMRTTNSFNTDKTTNNLLDCSTSSPFSLLRHQPDNYRNWLMLQEIFRNNDLMKQFQPPTNVNDDESDQENDDNNNNNNNNDDDDENSNDDMDDMDDENPTSSDEIPLDLSMKMDGNQHDMEQTSIKLSNSKQPISTKHTKTALAPLREQDTSKYRYINTMELVQTVKDILSRYSISQRHFGEKILGLSQGSVSDILARPKQWELLTQKGREPFLRMRLFLDDPNAIKQLVQTVTTAPPIISSPPSTITMPTTTNTILMPTFCPPSIIPPSSILANCSSLNGYHTNKLLTLDNSTDSQSNILLNDSSQLSINETIQVPSSSPLTSNGLGTNSNKSRSRSKTPKVNNDKPSVSSNHSRHSSANPLMTPYELPKIVLPTTMDTEQLSSQVRELLFAYSIGQRVFGEAVLNLSQGTVSEILSKPRPWHSLSVKGREPYLRMYTWYHDTGNVQKLLAWKRERDALRRSRPPSSKIDNGDSESKNNNSTITKSSSFSSSSSAITTTTTTNNNNNNPKRRYLFTDDQRRVLKQTFENEPYPSQSTLEQLVTELSLPMNKIANWFHNSRMRAKTSIHSSSSPLNKISTASINNDDLINPQSGDDDDDLDDNNNNNNNNNIIDEDDDDDDDYPILPTIVPLTSSWLNGTNDSNSSTSPVSLSATSTNIVSLIDDHKIAPVSSSSSSKKRKSVPQKIVTTNNNSTKRFHNESTIIENDSNDELNQKANQSTNLVDILT